MTTLQSRPSEPMTGLAAHTDADLIGDGATSRVPALEPVRTGARTAVSAVIARRLFTAAIRHLDVSVEEAPNSRGVGRIFGRGGPRMVIHRPDEFYARVGRDGLIGFGEAYLTGAWDADDLAEFLTIPAARIATLVPEPLQRARAYVTHRTPGHHRGTTDNTQANIAHHYDLSNELFALFLDETLSYSSALFDTPVVDGSSGRVAIPPVAGDMVVDQGTGHGADFAEAQGRKIDRLLDEAGVTAGTRLLEIGTGWGELAIRAARRGATVHSITLSVEQLELAERRVAAAGCSDLVRIELQDYRALAEPEFASAYDAIVSVEMIEAVGHEFWGTYFQTLDHALAPGGRVAIQAITMPHDRMLATQGTETWINKYVFPGGFLPSVHVIDEITSEQTSLRRTGLLEMGSHYAETLRRWDERFLAQREAVLALGFDDLFMRMWHFYLEYSRAGFASGYINVQQLTFVKADIRGDR
ncbi:MAG: Cyclopropane-fatty-acyl-phospholipid synthase [Nocardioides sp.]|uniref:SAM-dependent methyltransferase n=1 Tax=Nocardioides sp. TaxID=35761 RepID=UPI002632EE68|nr:cyclopropane-fatty-acyl-phospholipid synthase family protein [Nocardioides sp.]MCW2834794.1 Cyclopropane-fatty-acyl-phospholipid synthase [Nocardioides sp.]